MARASIAAEIEGGIAEDELWYSRVWQLRGGRWQIAAGHCSRAAE
ncbi:nuclear transport factor 2 family protein [Saccharibacillus alkalitolerans]|uniref:Nuclear transport factor 2 family protein n=1 Tax=Saccharibacillus alkalitolerans TaxID=2705290 RepID=A0ABX0F344_9BACL|nr:nuclear transport factor 2 family protein [Saccharibacillus alkalitolerans]NGZ74039.1 nuclear transport factor 2 family protein [Saccharibacillus alkalitolerans]